MGGTRPPEGGTKPGPPWVGREGQGEVGACGGVGDADVRVCVGAGGGVHLFAGEWGGHRGLYRGNGPAWQGNESPALCAGDPIALES